MNNNTNNLDNFFSFISKAVIIIPIFVLVVSLFFKFNSSKNTPNNDFIPSPTPAKQESIQNNSIKFDLKGPIVCDNLFIKDKKVLLKNKTTNYLLNGDCLYIWETGKSNGEKKCGLTNYINLSENYLGFLNINDLVNNNLIKDLIKDKNIDITNVLKNCKRKEIKDDSVFDIPKKMSRLRPTFPSSFDVSIIGADSFHDLVRDGKGWDQVAQVTRTSNSI